MLSLSQILKGIRNPRMAVQYSTRKLEPHVPLGTNIFDLDWDTLIVVDACRYDLFREFAPRHSVYDSFSTVSSIYSVASTTQNWLPNTFDTAPDEVTNETHYVTCTSFAEEYIDEGDVHQIDHVWKYAKDPDSGLTKPEAVTDAGIKAIRNTDAERVILHYVQPHAPFLHCLGKYNSRSIRSGDTQNVWRLLEEGEYDKSEVWDDYGQNLLRALDEVETVITNTTGRIVITSDHGNALGEWGIYGHHGHIPTKQLRKVPWVETEGLGGEEYEIEGKQEMKTTVEQPTVEEHLEALGYR